MNKNKIKSRLLKIQTSIIYHLSLYIQKSFDFFKKLRMR